MTTSVTRVAILTPFTPAMASAAPEVATTSPGSLVIARPPANREREAFNGLGEVVFEVVALAGTITRTATGPGLIAPLQKLDVR